jgi:hypothetical protein
MPWPELHLDELNIQSSASELEEQAQQQAPALLLRSTAVYAVERRCSLTSSAGLANTVWLA